MQARARGANLTSTFCPTGPASPATPCTAVPAAPLPLLRGQLLLSQLPTPTLQLTQLMSVRFCVIALRAACAPQASKPKNHQHTHQHLKMVNHVTLKMYTQLTSMHACSHACLLIGCAQAIIGHPPS